MLTLRIVNYETSADQAPPALGQLRMRPHTDYGVVTVLYADDAPGLEICTPEGDWRALRPEPGALVVNLGDLTARWTNDRLRSTLRRVARPPADLAGPAKRRSVAFFLDANYDARRMCSHLRRRWSAAALPSRHRGRASDREVTRPASGDIPDDMKRELIERRAEVPSAALPSIQVLPQLVAKTPRLKGKKTKVKSPVLPGLFEQLRGGDSSDVPRALGRNARIARGVAARGAWLQDRLSTPGARGSLRST